MGIDTNQIKTNENLRCTYKLLVNDNDNEILAVSPLICDYFKQGKLLFSGETAKQ